jgi:hypothetical protein
MTQADNRDTTKVSRRSALAGLAGASAAAAVTGGTALARPDPAIDDPAIRAADEYHRAWKTYNQAYERSCSKGSDWEKDDVAYAEVETAHNAVNSATDALFDVTPTTILGAVALLEAIAFYDDREADCSALEWWVHGGDATTRAANDTLLEIAAVLRKGVPS